MPQATAQLLASTTPGWVVVSYQPWRRALPGEVDATADGWAYDAFSLLLVSPAGERYHLVDLPKSSPVALDRWQAGSREIDVTYLPSDPGRSFTWAKLDLLSGTLRAGPEIGSTGSSGFAADGRRVLVSSPGDPVSVRLVDFGGVDTLVVAGVAMPSSFSPKGDVQLDPSGTRLLLSAFDDRYSLVDLASGRVTGGTLGLPGKVCYLVAWFDATSFLEMCQEDAPDASRSIGPDSHPALYRIAADGSEPPRLVDEPVRGEPYPYGAAIGTVDGIVAEATTVGGGGAPDLLPTDGTWLWASQRERPTELVPPAPVQFAPRAVVGATVYGSCYPREHPIGQVQSGVCSLTGAALTWLLPVASGDASAAELDSVSDWTVAR